MALTIAVTGATGFLGRALCAALVQQGHRVRAFTRAGRALPELDVVAVPLRDLDDQPALRRGCEGADAVVHLAARTHLLRDSATDPEREYHRINVEGTSNVIAAAVAGRVDHVVMLSSVKAVGESNERAWTEEETPAPLDGYGRSKLAAERAAQGLESRDGIRISVLRLPLVYGPGAKANVHRLLSAVDRGWPLPFGAVNNRRSMIYVDNAVAAIIALLETPPGAGGVYFASDRTDLSTPELVRVIARSLDRAPRLVSVPVPLLRALGMAGDLLRRIGPFPITSAEIERLVGSLAVDASRLTLATGFVPPVSVEEGWRHTAQWYVTSRRPR